MKTTILVLLIITICCAAVAWFVIKFMWAPGGWQNNLVSPVLQRFSGEPMKELVEDSSQNSPPKVPRTFKFDENTDLNLELEKVNPEVSDEDFF